MASSVVGLLRVVLSANSAEFDSVLKKSAETSKRFGKDLDDVGKKAAQTGKMLTEGIGAGFLKFTNGIDGAIGSLRSLAGETNPAVTAIGNVSSKIGAMAGGLSALGPAAGAAAIGLGAITVAGGAVVVVVGALGSELLSLTTSAADAGDALLVMSNKTGLTVEAVSELQFVAKQTDVPLEAMTAGIFKLGQNLSQGGDKATKAVKALGLSLSQLRGLKPEEAFTTIITKLRDIPDAGQRAAVGVALFGKQFKEIAGLTQEDMQGLIKQAHDMGLVMSTEFAVAGDRFNDDLLAIGAQIDAVKMKIGAEFIPTAIAFVETFGTQFTKALQVAGAGAGGFSKIVSDVAIGIGQALAAIIEVGAPVADWIVQFLAGKFITNLGLVDFFARVLSSLQNVAAGIDILVPGFAGVADKIKSLADKTAKFAEIAGTRTIQAAAGFHELADAAAKAAAKTGKDLPDAVKRVTTEIDAQAAAMRKAKADATGFGGELDLTADKSDKLAKEQAQVAKEVASAKAEITALSAVISDFGARVDAVVESEDRWAAALPVMPLTAVVGKMQAYDVAAEQAKVSTDVLTAAFKTLGVTSQAQLDETARKAREAYQVIASSGNASKEDIKHAFDAMKAAAEAAANGTKTSWSDVFPHIKGIVENIQSAVQGSFSQMLLGAKGFHDGFLDIWKSLKAGIAQILTDILGNFTDRFLKGLLNAITGAQGGFASAFKGLLGGGLGSLLGGGTAFAGVPGTMVPGGAAGTWAGTGGAAGGIGLGGILGGIGAGGAGVGLGFLFKHLFGGAGAAAGAAGGASGAATGALIGSIVPGLGTAIGALIGGIGGLISGLFGKTKNMKANDARDVFISQFGPAGTGADSGFMKLAAKLTELTGEAGGGSLFKALMDAHNVEDVAKAVAAINAELAKSKDLTDQNTEAVDAQKAKYEELRAQIQSQMDDLNKQLDDINRSEAPEEHMGAIEKAQRESIARQQDELEKQMQAAQEAQKKALEALGQNSADTLYSLRGPIDDLSGYAIGPAGFGKMGGFFKDDLPAAGQGAFDNIAQLFGQGIDIPYTFVATNAPPTAPEPPDNTPGFATGTPNLSFMNFGTGQLATLHGREAVVPEGQAGTFAAMHTGNAGAVTLVVLQSTGTVDGDLDLILRAAPSIAKNKRGARGILRDALAVR